MGIVRLESEVNRGVAMTGDVRQDNGEIIHIKIHLLRGTGSPKKKTMAYKVVPAIFSP